MTIEEGGEDESSPDDPNDEPTDPGAASALRRELEALQGEVGRHGKLLAEMLERVERLSAEVIQLRTARDHDHATLKRVRGRLRNARRHLEHAARELGEETVSRPPGTEPKGGLG